MQKQLFNYQDYFNTQHWKNLKRDLITDNKKAKCALCHSKKCLIPHHTNYDHLGCERIGRDIQILCFDCHQLIHFWFFKLIRVPLKKKYLLLSFNLRALIRSLYMFQPFRALKYFTLTAFRLVLLARR